MPRKMRVEHPGAIYHVMDRGDRREDIFLDDVDRQDFLKTLAEARFMRTLPSKWIAARVRLGTSKSANVSLHDWMRFHGAVTVGPVQPQPMVDPCYGLMVDVRAHAYFNAPIRASM
jgi:hypothetical protein